MTLSEKFGLSSGARDRKEKGKHGRHNSSGSSSSSSVSAASTSAPSTSTSHTAGPHTFDPNIPTFVVLKAKKSDKFIPNATYRDLKKHFYMTTTGLLRRIVKESDMADAYDECKRQGNVLKVARNAYYEEEWHGILDPRVLPRDDSRAEVERLRKEVSELREMMQHQADVLERILVVMESNAGRREYTQ